MTSNFVVVGDHRTCHIPVITSMMHGEVFLILYFFLLWKIDATNNEEKDTSQENLMLRHRGVRELFAWQL